MTPQEELVREVARGIMLAQGCGLTADEGRVFCEDCDCLDSAKSAIAIVVERCAEVASKYSKDNTRAHNEPLAALKISAAIRALVEENN